MPGLDDRLERGLRDAARFPDAQSTRVVWEVANKRARRRARRRAASAGVTAAVVLGAAVGALALVDRDGGGGGVRVATNSTEPMPTAPAPPNPAAAREQITETLQETSLPGASPPATGVQGDIDFLSDTEAMVSAGAAYRGLRVQLVDGQWELTPASRCRIDDPAVATEDCARLVPDVRVHPETVSLGPEAYAGTPAPAQRLSVPVDGHEYVRGPLVPAGATVWAAAYRRDGPAYTFPDSRLVGFAPDSGRVEREVELQGEILSSFAEGKGPYWAVTHDRTVIGPQDIEFRLKRVDPDGSVDSNEIPPGEVPAGPVVARAGSVWAPVRSGVLRFDGVSGDLVQRVPLGPDQQRRRVAAVDSAVLVTAGTGVQRVHPEGTLTNQIDLASASPVTELVVTGDSAWALAPGSSELFRLDHDVTAVEQRLTLPTGLGDTTLHAAGDTVWVTGTADLAGDSSGTTSVATERVVLMLDSSGFSRTVVVAGTHDAAETVTATGELLLTTGGDVYRVALDG